MIEFITAEEVAELLRLSPNRVLLLARRGEIPSFSIDGRVRFDAREIEEWLRSRRDGKSEGQTLMTRLSLLGHSPTGFRS